jgi:hypothetical protein
MYRCLPDLIAFDQSLAHFEAGQVPTVFINTDSTNAGFNNELILSGHFVQVHDAMLVVTA